MCLTHGDRQGADPRARQPQTSALPDQSLSVRAALPISLPQVTAISAVLSGALQGPCKVVGASVA